MIISHAHRFIFVRTEKTAGSSIERALAPLCAPTDIRTGSLAHYDPELGLPVRAPAPWWVKRFPVRFGSLRRTFPQLLGLHAHTNAAHAKRIVGDELFGAYFKFAVERNPWDRQVSLYFQRRRQAGEADALDFDRDMRSVVFRALHYTRLRNWETYTIGDRISVDRVIRYERLAEELGEVTRRLGLPELNLGSLRSGFRDEARSYRDFYSPATRELVGGWYRKEIEAFGYEF
jgi:hypothetical protein